jgi:hypothetical protein
MAGEKVCDEFLIEIIEYCNLDVFILPLSSADSSDVSTSDRQIIMFSSKTTRALKAEIPLSHLNHPQQADSTDSFSFILRI